ncbi:RagB/SusD family nutrient uptake outer membrane protein [Gaoshiqia sediminis]|uniref:RagB/SusD family nutrient uptake outer membrane protein n=1 Tax=Gaoshiqia sediminis TaxID=2986998 RepID=A0AA42C4I2_9BACT|nr:RagB/SusD family nutrient uptake outer membrane protein [Gaoshiqia sediminis]MCW0481803.1 RagB/SusD family nutrient uptake outer membrane protein [Gaoshiqia sediminis]
MILKNIFKKSLWGMMLLPLITGCDDEFLVEKKDFSGFNEEIYNDVQTAQAKVDYIYYLSLPGGTTGGSDDFSKSTEEFVGSSKFTQLSEVTKSNVNDYFFSKSTSGPYAFIRECNMFLDNIDNGTLTEDEKTPLKAQVYFWRAWHYSKLVNTYGGVPIVLTAQNAILGEGDITQSDLAVPRSSTAKCIEQIIKDLDLAIAGLPGSWNDANWGRITSGAAAALKGRVLLTYASPLFNRNDDGARWQAAYDANLAAKQLLEANGFGLADGTGNRAEKWEKIFVTPKTSEAVITVLHNTVTTDSYKKNNGWEQSARPKEAQGNGGYGATAEMVDLFPMKDGKRPGESTDFTYDPLKFYKDRDPRFYRTFAFNGVVWPYKQDAAYTVWSYQWFKDDASFISGKEGQGFAEYAGRVNTGVYVRKRTNPAAEFSATDKFSRSATPYIEMRFAEVVLNLAEAAVGIGNLNEGYEGLKAIRNRVGIPAGADGNYGIPAGLDRDGLFREILYERQIEFAYEGRRFEDMRRWMLWNDDATINNNTCARLGVEPFNGKRHHGIILGVKPEIYTASKSGLSYDVFNPLSPIYNETLVTRAGIAVNPNAADADFEAQIALLDNFYGTNLARIENDQLDPLSPRFEVTYLSKYYFLGLKENVMKQSPYLLQTIGWDDYYGNPGTFDPLAE